MLYSNKKPADAIVSAGFLIGVYVPVDVHFYE